MKQIAIITGGASGIGLALGTALVKRGWHVVLDDIQDVTAKDEAERLTRAGPGSAVAAGVDVRDADPLISLVQDTHAEERRAQHLVVVVVEQRAPCFLCPETHREGGDPITSCGRSRYPTARLVRFSPVVRWC